MSETRSPAKTRRALPVAVALLVLGAGAVAFWALRPKTRFVTAVAPIGPKQAVLVTRRNEDHATWHWLQLEDADGTVRWSVDTGTHGVLASLDEAAVAATKRRVYALLVPGGVGDGPDEVRLLALDRATGRRLWDVVADPHAGTGRVSPDSPAVLVDRRRVYVALGTTRTGRIDAFARGTGKHLWTRAIDRGFRGAARFVDPGHLLLTSYLGETLSLDRKTGAVDGHTHHWFLGDVPGGLAFTDLVSVIVRHPDGHDTRYPVAKGTTPWTTPSVVGVRGQLLVVGVHQRARPSAALVAYDRRTRAPVWTLEVGATSLTRFLGDGRALPRLLPVGIYGAPGPHGSRHAGIVVVDLDAGRIVQRYDLGDMADVAIAAAGRPWVWLDDDTLVALDPRTGAVARATTLAGAGLVGPDLHARDLRFGQLWLFRDDYVRPSRLPFAIVNLATGTVGHLHAGMTTRDVTAKVRAAWRPSP